MYNRRANWRCFSCRVQGVWLGRQLWCQAVPAEPPPKTAAELSSEMSLCSFGLRLSSAPSLTGQGWDKALLVGIRPVTICRGIFLCRERASSRCCSFNNPRLEQVSARVACVGPGFWSKPFMMGLHPLSRSGPAWQCPFPAPQPIPMSTRPRACSQAVNSSPPGVSCGVCPVAPIASPGSSRTVLGVCQPLGKAGTLEATTDKAPAGFGPESRG